MSRQLRLEDYTVGWVCALPVELAAALEMLDEEHETPQSKARDTNIYTCGRIGEHNVVIACLPNGHTGTNSAAAVASQMMLAFTSTRFGLMVGIGGGVSSEEADIRLGDVVVSSPHKTHGGVVQYDFGKATPSGFERTGSLNAPPTILLNAVTNLQANLMRGKCRLTKYLSKLNSLPIFEREAAGLDALFEATYNHEGGATTCDKCSKDYLVTRKLRRQEVAVHYGTIASGNQVMRDASERDKVSAELGGVLCFEMEAAGLMNSFPCLVIRGICDYADSHKNKQWQPYAAGTAAAYAKEVLSVIPVAEVVETRPMEEATRLANKRNSSSLSNPPAKRRKIDSSDDLESNIADQQTSIITSRSQVKSTARLLPTPREMDCLRSLSFPEQEHRYDDIHTAEKDTCKWLLTDPQYCAWMESPRGLFWIKGNPGAGKSVLMRFATRKMREKQPSELVLSFFIHGQGTELQKTPLGIFRALLNSMLKSFPAYLTQLTERFENRENQFGGYMANRWKWTEKELQEFLSNVLTKGTKNQSVTIFIDALDECGEGPAKSLLVYFSHLVKQIEQEQAQVKICLSSRHYPILGLDTIPALHVEERNDKDIQWYTRERLKDFQPKSKRKQIEEQILLKAQGGFQWVFLVTEIVIGGNLNGFRAETLQKELASCPTTLMELYATILSSVPRDQQRQMVKLFQWVMFAERPLSAQELREALATDKDMSCTSVADLRTHEGWSDTLVGFERYVKHISGGLVQFQTREIFEQYVLDEEDSDREAQLIHQSVADYLFDKFLNEDIEHNQHVYRSLPGASHFQISRSCLKYLTLVEVLEGARLPRGTLSSRFPLAPYATRFIFKHIQKVEQEGVLQPDLPSLIQWAPQSETMRKLSDLWRVLDPDSAHTPIGWPFIGAAVFYFLAASGLKSALNAFLEKNDEELNGRDSDGNTLLLISIIDGQEDIALMLLDWSAKRRRQYNEETDQSISEDKATKHQENRYVDINAKNNDGDTALTIVLAEKAREVVSKLIEADTDLKYLGRDTALVFDAISCRKMKLLAKLIEMNVNLDGAVFLVLEDCSPQQEYVLEKLLEKLLKARANKTESLEFERISEPEDEHEYESSFDDDALFLASRRGLTGVVNLLLSHGAPTTSQNSHGECPLMVAIQNDHEEVVRSLLQNAPSAVEMENDDGLTALDVAYKKRKLELTMLLLREGGFTTLSPVLERLFFDFTKDGAVDLVEAILQMNSVIPNSKRSSTPTVPSCAAANGNIAVVQLLLETSKVNIDAKDSDGRTPLSWAAQKGYEAVIKLLIETGKADVVTKDSDGWTPLFYAAQNGHEAVIKLLLETGKVDVDTKDSDGLTPLFCAVQNGYEAVIKLLLETGKVDIDVNNNSGRTPLSWAAQKGYEAVTKLLLKTGKVDVNAKDKGGWTPLSWAAVNRHEAVIKLLLLETSKVDVNVKDNSGRTPLSLAAAKGHVAILKLLQSHGSS